MEDGTSPDNGENDSDGENFITLWGWLSGVVDWLKSIFQGISEIPSKIGESLNAFKNYIGTKFAENTEWFETFKTYMAGRIKAVREAVEALPDAFTKTITDLKTNLMSRLSTVVTTVGNIPKNIEEKIKGIFVPDTDAIQESLDSFLNDLKMKFNFNTDAFNTLFDGESAVEDKKGSYNIHGLGSLNLTFLDTKYLIQGVTYFRPFIRGFLVLLMFIFNIKMTLSFIRQDAGTVTGKAVSMGGNKE